MALLETRLETGAYDSPSASDEGRTVIHSHHYNLALVRTVLGSDRIDARAILEIAAAELAFQTLRERAAAERWRGAERWCREAVALFRSSGLGELNLDRVDIAGGEAQVVGSHFSGSWGEKYGRSKTPVCSVAAGFLAGALAAAHGRRYVVTEISCVAQQKAQCRFRVTTEEGEVGYAEAPIAPAGAQLSFPAPVPPAFDEVAVIAALLDTQLEGDPHGRIPAFGGAVTRLWADYYNQVSYRFEREIPRVMGNKFTNLPSLVLTEAGHTCAFHTFGEILRSEAWAERVAPLLHSREDWLHASVAVINTLGWGTWRVHAVEPGVCATIRIYDGYEAMGYRRLFGRADAPKCYFARGTVAALMNLLYVGDITERRELTQSYYNQLFRSPLSFRATEACCRAVDDTFCELIANPLAPGLNTRLLIARGE